MLGLVYSRLSQADLEEIWDYIAFDSERQAEAVLDRMHAKIELLRTQPRMGHRRDDIRRGSRCVKSDSYLIFYRFDETVVRIDRIVHHSRHLARLSLYLP